MEGTGKKSGFRKWLVSFGRGDFLIRWKVDKALPHITVLFVLSLVSMFLSYKAEQTMVVRERNRAAIETLRIRRSQAATRIASMNRLTTIDSKLKEMGSTLELSLIHI